MTDFVQQCLKSSGEDPTLHFFRRDFTYSCSGYQALFIADEFYHTRHGIRMENGLESLSISKKFFRTVCEALVDSHKITIWAKRTPEVNSPFDIVAKSSPGDVQAVEDEVGTFGEYTNVAEDKFLCIAVNSSELHRISIVSFCPMDQYLVVHEVEDLLDFSTTANLLPQIAARSCSVIVCSDSKISTIPVMSLLGDDDEDDAKEAPDDFDQLRSTLQDLGISFTVKKVTSLSEKEQQEQLKVLLRRSSPSSSVQSQSLPELSRLQELQSKFTHTCSLQAVATVLKLAHVDEFSSTSGDMTVTFRYLKPGSASSASLWLDLGTQATLQMFPPSGSSGTSKGTGPRRRDRSLYDLLDRNCTGMGRRLLRQWLHQPLRDLPQLQQRQHLVSYFMSNTYLLSQLTEMTTFLRSFPDLDKLVQRLQRHASSQSEGSKALATQSALRDLLENYRCLTRAQRISELLSRSQSSGSAETGTVDLTSEAPSSSIAGQLSSLCTQCQPLQQLVETVVDAEHMEHIRLLRQQSSAEQAAGASASSSGKKSTAKKGAAQSAEYTLSAAQMQAAQRLFRDRFYRVTPSLSTQLEATHAQLSQVASEILEHYSSVARQVCSCSADPPAIHLERNDVHGLHFRVTKRQFPAVTKALTQLKIAFNVQSQQKAGCLFQTRSLESLEQRYEQLHSEYAAAQGKVVLEALKVWNTYVPVLRQLARAVAQIDVLSCLAQVAIEYDWTMPQLCEEAEDVTTASGEGRQRDMFLQGLYHPLLRERLGASAVVRSDVRFTAPRLAAIITGPNMGGKSSWLKAVGLAVVLAQLGSAVPCTSARIPLFDRVFLRSGSAESASLGASSFLSEMSAVAEMLRLASSQSLVLVDELGRGTSTADGFGLAWAVLEELAVERRATVLCATHFHELSMLENERFEGMTQTVFQSLHVDAHVDVAAQQITMLYALQPGSSDRSYGVHCAELAGFPQEIVQRAQQLEAAVMNQSEGARKRSRDAEVDSAEQQKRQRK